MKQKQIMIKNKHLKKINKGFYYQNIKTTNFNTRKILFNLQRDNNTFRSNK